MARIPAFEAWADLPWRVEGFSLCLIASSCPSGRDFVRFARHLLDDGIVAFAAWGDGSEACHDAFDETAYPYFAQGLPVVMTTWHVPENEDVVSCVEFFLTTLWPDDDHLGRWTSARILAAGIPDETWTVVRTAAREACT